LLIWSAWIQYMSCIDSVRQVDARQFLANYRMKLTIEFFLSVIYQEMRVTYYLIVISPVSALILCDSNCSHINVMLVATTSYVVCILGVILMYIWYTPEPSCILNIFFITWTLVLLQLMTSVSLHPKVKSYMCLLSIDWCPDIQYKVTNFGWKQVNAGFLTPGLMGLYVVFLCWCAIRRYASLSYLFIHLHLLSVNLRYR
jgi:hypothetical protein